MLLAVPFMLTIVGLFLIKYSIVLRSKLFYTAVKTVQESTHVYILGTDGIEEIVDAREVTYADKQINVFLFKELAYKVWKGKRVPIDLELHNELPLYQSTMFRKTGLTIA